MMTVYDNFHKLLTTYFHKFSNIAYKNNVWYLQKQFNVILVFAIKIAYASLS
jgi:hypothetical protein